MKLQTETLFLQFDTDVAIESDFIDIMFINKGDTVAFINGFPLNVGAAPVAPNVQRNGEVLSINGYKNQINKSNIQLVFDKTAPGTVPLVHIIRTVYKFKDK